MSTLRWVDGLSQSPPGRNKTRPEQRHTAEEWELWMPRAVELYKEYPMSEVRQKLEDQGFIASEKQLKDRITKDNGKYFKLPESQWQSVARKAFVRWREDPTKSTAFRLRDKRKMLPPARIKRGLEERFKKPHSRDFSLGGTISSRGISAYTSNSNGFRVRGGLLANFQRAAGLSGNSASMRSLDGTTRQMLGPFGTNDFANDYVLKHHLERLRSNPSVNTWMNALRAIYEDARFRSVENLSWNASGVTQFCKLICEDCPGHEFCVGWHPKLAKVMAKRSLCWSDFLEFGESHLENNHHRQRVKLRLLFDEIRSVCPDPNMQWGGRASFVNETGISCGHWIPPPDCTKEKDHCFEPGGCRWSQFKAAEDINLKYLLLHKFGALTEDGGCGHTSDISDASTGGHGDDIEELEVELQDVICSSFLGSDTEYHNSAVPTSANMPKIETIGKGTAAGIALDLTNAGAFACHELIQKWFVSTEASETEEKTMDHLGPTFENNSAQFAGLGDHRAGTDDASNLGEDRSQSAVYREPGYSSSSPMDLSGRNRALFHQPLNWTDEQSPRTGNFNAGFEDTHANNHDSSRYIDPRLL